MGSSTSLRQLVPELFDDRENLLAWPPDVFAVTSKALKATGAYRLATAVHAQPPWPPSDEWIDSVKRHAREWWDGDADSTVIQMREESYAIVEQYRDLPLDQFGFTGAVAEGQRPESETKEATKVSQALLKLHVLSDEASAGLGVLSGGSGKQSLMHFVANALLTETGSLSRLPRAHGIVLPKMRTSQVGLTLRSFSHHLTYHQTEAFVVWRAMPWVNIDENTINMLIVPWPFDLNASAFKPRISLGRARSVRHARFFEYRQEGRFDPELIVRYLQSWAAEHAERVHILAMPEVAIQEEDLNELKHRLASSLDRDRIPMLLIGVGTPGDPENIGRNQVVLSTFFAGKWYDLVQGKHHRWKIDEPQVLQYGLGGVLTGESEWWEAVEIPNRRVSFLVPNGWLALAPLICEDLAQLEPVSELIRGVGPTLVVSLLFDGPQLTTRWSYRYASVMADDPGSSVLTVTNLAMARRSRVMGRDTDETMRLMGDRSIALWKDQVRGTYSIKLPENHEAALLTTTASWTEEFTADGRSDDENAARFVLKGVMTLGSEDPEGRARNQPSGSTEQYGLPERVRYDTKKESDLLELSLITYLVDAMIDAGSSARAQISSVAAASGPDGIEELPGIVEQVLETLRNRSEFRRRLGSAQDDQADDYRLGIDLLHRYLERHCNVADPAGETAERRMERYGFLVDHCSLRLKEIKEAESVADVLKNLELSEDYGLPPDEILRVELKVTLVLLWAIHRRISARRASGRLSSPWAQLLEKIEQLLAQGSDHRCWRLILGGAPASE